MSFLRDPIWQFISVIFALVAIVISLVQENTAWVILGISIGLVIIILIISSSAENTIDDKQSDRSLTIGYTSKPKNQFKGEKLKWLWSLCILLGTLGGLTANLQNPDLRVTLIGTVIGVLVAFFIYSLIS